MQNDTISYTQHTGEVARGAGDGVGPAWTGAPVGLGESVHEACYPAVTGEGSRADGFVETQKAVRARESAHSSVQASGRSMIEMLGVLAIIGALSVGGLAALRVAQNKLRANVIANDVMLAAADLLARQDVLTAGSVINTFSFTPKTTTLTAQKCADANIELMITGVPQAVCEQVVRNGAVKGTQGIGVAKSGSAFCDGSVLNGSCSVGENNNLVFVLGANTRELCGGEYCKDGYYCRYSPSSCSDKGTGVCTPNGGLPSNTVTLSSGTVYIGPSMDWWSAGSYCESLGKELLSATGLCGFNPVPSKDWTCCTTKTGSADQDREDGSICDVRRVANGDTSVTADYPFTSDFRTLWNNTTLKSSYGWLSNDCGNDCSAYGASFVNGFVYNSPRNNYRYALCQ